MTHFSAILIDDEVHCNESLELLLAECFPQVMVAAKFSKPGEALSWLKNNQPDLVFLDIEMPGMNGFELLGRLGPTLRFDVIFVTAYDQYAVKAFQYSAINYLLKPVDQEELRTTLLRWSERTEKVLSTKQLDLMYELLKQSAREKKRIALPTHDGLEFIEIQQIIRCESDSNYTRIHSSNGERHLICRTLKEVEKVLGESGFLRVHHSHLVNPSYVRKLIRTDGGSIVMVDDTEIPFSKGKKDRMYELISRAERI